MIGPVSIYYYYYYYYLFEPASTKPQAEDIEDKKAELTQR